jgi:hypothetical protein
MVNWKHGRCLFNLFAYFYNSFCLKRQPREIVFCSFDPIYVEDLRPEVLVENSPIFCFLAYYIWKDYFLHMRLNTCCLCCGTVTIYYGSGSDHLTSYCSDSGSGSCSMSKLRFRVSVLTIKSSLNKICKKSCLFIVNRISIVA